MAAGEKGHHPDKDLSFAIISMQEAVLDHSGGLKALAFLILNSDDEFLTKDLGILIEDWLENQKVLLDNFIRMYVPEETGSPSGR